MSYFIILEVMIHISGFAWDAMLKTTDINLKLITDIVMYQMVEKG